MKCYVCKKPLESRDDNKTPIFCEEHQDSAIRAGALVNTKIAREDFHKKTIEKGVKGRDLIQPYGADGKYNKEYFHHYGDKAFTNEEQRKKIKKELG